MNQRLRQLYDDLEPFEANIIGPKVAAAYNALLENIAGKYDEADLKGTTRVTERDTGRTVRLLVGQLILIVGGS